MFLRSQNLSSALIALCLTAGSLLTGCDGGTRGTGNGVITVRGLVLSSVPAGDSQDPLLDAVVTVDSLDGEGEVVDSDSAGTDGTGMFVTTVEAAAKLRIRLSGKGVD